MRNTGTTSRLRQAAPAAGAAAWGDRAAATRPSLRLFLFHHAGGSAQLFHDWGATLPANWEACAMEAPGRGALTGVPAIDRCESLVDYFQAELLPRLDRPFAFFGHSMGAMVAYSLACRLRSLGHPQPVWLGLSACGSPRAGGTGTLQSEQSDAELKEWLLRAGGTPPEVIRHPLLWRFLNPVLRSDLRVVDSWRPDTAAAALPCALSVFGGRDDAVVPPEQLAGWQPYGRDFFGVRLFGGGHSYLHENPEFVRQVTESIQLALR